MWPTPFQFHKGTIRTSVPLDDECTPLPFQFHKGTIRTVHPLDDECTHCHFNSIKVQLEHIGKYGYNEFYLFQFHKGTIRTDFCDFLLDLFSDFNSIKVQLELTFHTVICLRLRYFNSIKVQLEPCPWWKSCDTQQNFNSIKVQLELKNYGCSVYVPPVFQFHKGTIRTITCKKIAGKKTISIP